MKPIITLAAVAVLLSLIGCSDGAGGAKTKGTPWTGAPLPVHEITIEIDEEAMAVLERFDDRVRVDTYYYGLPTEASVAKANERHELEMGHSMTIVDRRTRTVRIRGETLDVTLLRDTADGQIHFKTSANGLTPAGFYHDVLECNTARGVLTQPQTRPRVVTCTLPTP